MIKKTVKENMSTRLITIEWNEPVENAYRRMKTIRVRHLPVTNESGEIVGMLSDRDVQRAMISQIERPYGTFSDEIIEFDRDSLVRDYMSWPAKSVDKDTDLRLVAERMISEKVSSLLVMDKSRPVGIVTAEDLIQVLIELLSDPGTPARWSLQSLLADSAHKFDGVLV